MWDCRFWITGGLALAPSCVVTRGLGMELWGVWACAVVTMSGGAREMGADEKSIIPNQRGGKEKQTGPMLLNAPWPVS